MSKHPNIVGLEVRHSSECPLMLHNESLVGCLKTRWFKNGEWSYSDCCAGVIDLDKILFQCERGHLVQPKAEHLK